jgi:outer membrane biosynthesis protein TonB
VLGRLVTLPIRLTVELIRLEIEGVKLALGLVREMVEADREAAPAPPPAAVRPDEQPAPEPEPPAPPPPPAPEAVEPLPRVPEPVEPDPLEPEPTEPVHVSEEPGLVAESADPEAADTATAEVHVAEPWDGYRHLKADDVIARVNTATAEELAVIELYEMTHRGRKSVLAAVEKQLRVLANRP